eukprot:5753870-Prymnesium_polylepis.1
MRFPRMRPVSRAHATGFGGDTWTQSDTGRSENCQNCETSERKTRAIRLCSGSTTRVGSLDGCLC